MTTFTEAPGPLAAYYRLLTSGPDVYGDGTAMTALLDPELDFEGPIAGRVSGAARFARGVAGFVATVRSIEPIHLVVGDGQVATHYTAELPGGPVRFSEFFTLHDGVISALRLQYDAADYVAKGGR